MTTPEGGRLNPEAMRSRIDELAIKGRLSAEHLKEFIWLIYEVKAIEDGDSVDSINYDGELRLPSVEDATVCIRLGEKNYGREWAEIILIDRLRPDDFPTGERIVLKSKSDVLQWRVGVRDSTYSEFLGRRVLLDDGDLDGVLADVNLLTAKEHAKVAKTIYQPYLDSLNQSPQPAA